MIAQRLKAGMDYNKTVMYWFDFSRDIPVEEVQILSHTVDRTILHYTVRDGDKAYFSKEYIPAGMSKEGTKKPDITAILENAAEKKVKWYIYDMKDTIINAKTALSLCNQWHSGIEHIEVSYLSSLNDYNIEKSVGVITRYWDRDKLQKEKDACQEKWNQAGRNRLLTARKSLPDLEKYRKRAMAVQFILDGVFVDDRAAGGSESYNIHYVSMTTVDMTTYTAEMDIRF